MGRKNAEEERRSHQLAHRTTHIKSVRETEGMVQWLECLPLKYEARGQIPRSHVKMPDECSGWPLSSVLEGKDKGSLVVVG